MVGYQLQTQEFEQINPKTTYESCILIAHNISRQSEVFYHMIEEQPSHLLHKTCIRCKYKYRIFRNSIHNNKDRFEVTNLWESGDEVNKDVFLRLVWNGAILQPSSFQSCSYDKLGRSSHMLECPHPSLSNNKIWPTVLGSFPHQDGLPIWHHKSPTTIPSLSHLQGYTIFLSSPQGGLIPTNIF